jgi:hypothetical protein
LSCSSFLLLLLLLLLHPRPPGGLETLAASRALSRQRVGADAGVELGAVAAAGVESRLRR